MGAMWRVAVRSLWRRPGLSATIILTLALGIGATSTIFSLVDAVLLKPLSYPEPDRLVAIHESNAALKRAQELVAPARLEEWNRLSQTFEGLAGCYFENLAETSAAIPERVAAMRTSPRFFAVLGTSPALGRLPSPDEERFGGPAVVVISDGYWARRFGRDPSAVGKQLTLGGRSRTIVGVMPAWFRFPAPGTDLWAPSQLAPFILQARAARFYVAVGRLKAGITAEQGAQDLNAVQETLARQFPETDRGWSAVVRGLKEEETGGARRSLILLFAAVTLVLLIACANIAGLLLARFAERRREIAVRMSLGAGKWAIVCQLLLETLAWSAPGAAGGLALTYGGVTVAQRLGAQMPRITEATVDLRVAAFCATLGLLTALLAGLAPAWQAVRSDMARALAAGSRTSVGGSARWQRALVSAQVALALIQLIGAGLLMRSFLRARQVHPGFDARGVVAFRMTFEWRERGPANAQRQLRTLERLAALPGVEATAISTVLPGETEFAPTEFHIAGEDSGAGRRDFAAWRAVSAGYFQTLRIPLLAGDTCRMDSDRRVALINRRFAERHFPNANPLGRRIVQSLGGPQEEAEIIGIAGDVREDGLLREPQPLIYYCGLMPFSPDPRYLVRARGDAAGLIPAIRLALREVDASRAAHGVELLDERVAATLDSSRASAGLLGASASAALLLAATGLYAVMAQFVARRTREIGLRMALGAQRRDILTHVLRPAAAMVLAGAAAGLILAASLARLATGLLYEIQPHDAATFGLAPWLLAGAALAGAVIPAWRALQIEPVAALRDE